MWTHYWDMNSGGGRKEKWKHIYIEAPKAEADVIFYKRFGHNPNRVSCTCCGGDYSISEDENLAQLTGYHRGLRSLETPRDPETGLYQNDDPIIKAHGYLEPGEEPPEGYSISSLSNLSLRLNERFGGGKELALATHDSYSESSTQIKKGSKYASTSSFKSSQIQQQLLKLIEGGVAETEERGGGFFGNGSSKLDLSNVLFIAAGAFSGLEVQGLPTTDDLVSYGMMPEFIGRFGMLTALEPMTLEALVSILVSPEGSVVSQFKELFNLRGYDLTFDKKALVKVAQIALSKGTGARGLRPVLENTLLETMFNSFSVTPEERPVVQVNAEMVGEI